MRFLHHSNHVYEKLGLEPKLKPGIQLTLAANFQSHLPLGCLSQSGYSECARAARDAAEHSAADLRRYAMAALAWSRDLDVTFTPHRCSCISTIVSLWP